MTANKKSSPTVKPPWKHQKASYAFFKPRPRGFDFSAAGTGKTRAHLEIYNARKDRKRLLVLCPKTLMRSAWGNDIEEFTPQLTYSLATAENREEAFTMATDVVIMNIDGIKWLAEKKNQKHLKGFDHLVIDEGSMYKHRTSQRTKAMMKIRGAFKYRYILTATPNANSVTELWAPAMIVEDGKRLGNSFFHFRNVMQLATQVGPKENHLRWDDRPGAAQAVEELLSDITIRHPFEVMTDVPANFRETKFFFLNDRTKKLYDKLENEAILALKDGHVTAVHAASLRQKLLQVASGAVYTEVGEYSVVDAQRYELIADLADECDHSVIFFNWKHQRTQLAVEFERRGYTFAIIDGDTKASERDAIVKRYQAGEYQTLLLHPRTGAHGLTLTRGDTTIFASPFYEADLLQQAIKRIHRGGQTKVTRSIFVCAKGTVEELVYDRVNEKEGRMNDLLQLIQLRRKT